MNLLGKGTISAALFAATASVVMAAPAQAFVVGDGFQFLTDVAVSGTSGAYTFDFTGNTGTVLSDNGFGAGFVMFDSFTIADIVQPGQPPIASWLTGIAYSGGDASFDLSSISYTEGDGFLNLNFYGSLFNAANNSFEGHGTFTLTNLTIGGGPRSVVGELAVREVPTPAAVLPVLGGLLGMASKRKRNEEENA